MFGLYFLFAFKTYLKSPFPEKSTSVVVCVQGGKKVVLVVSGLKTWALGTPLLRSLSSSQGLCSVSVLWEEG